MSHAELIARYNQVVRELSFTDEQKIVKGELSEEDKKSPKMNLARKLYLEIQKAKPSANVC